MRFEFQNKKLKALYTTEKGARRYGATVVAAFFEVLASIDAAADERDLRELKSLHYEKLKGKLSRQHSLRLTAQFRLVVEREKDEQGVWLLIIDIDSHQYR